MVKLPGLAEARKQEAAWTGAGSQLGEGRDSNPRPRHCEYTVRAQWYCLRRGGYGVDIAYTVGTIHTMKSADLISLLKADGWVLRSVKGSHHVFTHPERPDHLTVPHPKKDLGKGLVSKLLKQSGLK